MKNKKKCPKMIPSCNGLSTYTTSKVDVSDASSSNSSSNNNSNNSTSNKEKDTPATGDDKFVCMIYIIIVVISANIVITVFDKRNHRV